MGRPLLTDEIIERANRGEDISGPPLMDDEETKVLPTVHHPRQFGYQSPQDVGQEQPFGYQSPHSQMSEETLHIQVEPTVTKSRRIENEKRGLFQAKLNKILVVIVCLLALLIAAIIWL